MQDRSIRNVGPLLHLVGAISRKTPYFKGKWRVVDWVFEKFLAKSGKVEVVPIGNGITIKCNLWDELQNGVWWLGDSFEKNQTSYIKSILKPGMTLLDVGANIGYYSIIASPILGDRGQIHAFEPVAQQYADLQANISRNNLKNIHAKKLIVSEKSGMMTINLGGDDNSGTASVAFAPSNNGRSETVETVSLDEYVAKNRLKVDVIKVDVEGHELSVFKGARETLKQQKPILLAEVKQFLFKRAGTSREELYSFLSELGYQAYAIRNNASLEKLNTPSDGILIVFKAS